jgi:hypothetical protein
MVLQYSQNIKENELNFKLELNHKIIVNATLGSKYGYYDDNIYNIQDTTYAGYIISEINCNNKISKTKIFGSFNNSL